MKKQKRLIAAIFLLALIANAGFAQVAADPNDSFYADLAVWETTGLVGQLYAARPYPIQLVKSILQTVIKSSPYQYHQSQPQYGGNGGGGGNGL